MCTVVWSVRPPRAYDRMYRVIDGVYLAYDTDSQTCLVDTDGIEYYYNAFGLALVHDYENWVIIRGARYGFSAVVDALCLCRFGPYNIEPIAGPFAINDSTVYYHGVHILWHSDTDFIIKHGPTLARIHVDWDAV